MSFTGDTIDTNEALACGLVSRIVAPEELMPEALKIAARIASNPSNTLRMSKKLIREAQPAQLETILEMSAALQSIAQHSDAHKAAINNLLPRR